MDDLNTMDVLEPSGEIQELYMTARAAVDELQRACIKFPTWPAKLADYCSDETSDIRKRLQEINDGKNDRWNVTANSIIMEELAETLEAAQKGDLEAARKECVQAMSMLLRLYVHLPYYCALARGEVANG